MKALIVRTHLRLVSSQSVEVSTSPVILQDFLVVDHKNVLVGLFQNHSLTVSRVSF